ncbi:MBL fold metallo-hydrolase [Kitasatospora sp. NPDC056138]|uniref:MBL fold metallo-hydrolase n=1 Tax=Kitasatospora sp. NPDC056138 TaxID=3345724 RepID=UPI0035DCA679
MTTELRIIGASCAVPNPGAATSGYLVTASQGTTVLLECGHGAVGALRRYIDPAVLSAVVVSHMHPDHFFDLVALRNYFYTRGLPPVDLHLPSNGPEILLGISQAMGLPDSYFPRAFRILPHQAGTSFRVGSLRMETMAARHSIEAHVMKVVDENDRSIVFSGDTAVMPELSDFAEGCDLLLVEVTDKDAKQQEPRYHMGPAEVAGVVQRSRPGLVVLTHYDAAHGDEILARVRQEATQADVLLATEGEVHGIG